MADNSLENSTHCNQQAIVKQSMAQLRLQICLFLEYAAQTIERHP